MFPTYWSCGTIPELSEAGVAGVIGVMGVSGVLYRGVFPGSAVVVEVAPVWEWKSWGVWPDVPGSPEEKNGLFWDFLKIFFKFYTLSGATIWMTSEIKFLI